MCGKLLRILSPGMEQNDGEIFRIMLKKQNDKKKSVKNLEIVHLCGICQRFN